MRKELNEEISRMKTIMLIKEDVSNLEDDEEGKPITQTKRGRFYLEYIKKQGHRLPGTWTAIIDKEMFVLRNGQPDFPMTSLLKINIMETKKVLTRENIPTNEINGMTEKTFRGIKLKYPEVYYIDNDVDEETGKINRSVKVKHYTKNQIERNIKALKNAYLIAKGAAAPS